MCVDSAVEFCFPCLNYYSCMGEIYHPHYLPAHNALSSLPSATAVNAEVLKWSLLPRLPRFYRGNQCYFLNNFPLHGRYRSRSWNMFPVTAVLPSGNPRKSRG